MTRKHSQVPPNRWKPSRVAQYEELYGLLADHADGMTMNEVGETMGVSTSVVRRVVRDLRQILGSDDQIAIITETVGFPNEPHVYKMVGTYDQVRGWVAGRVGDATTRIQTVHYSMAAIVRGADKRTMDGKRAALIEMRLRHLLEELAEIGSGPEDPTLF